MHRPRLLVTCSTVVALVASEIAALRLLLLLGRVEGFAVDWSDPAGWAGTADTADLLAAAGRLTGIALAAWLIAGTLASLARRAVPVWREVQELDALSLPLVRRALDRLMAVSLGASAVLGPAAAASASTPGSSVPASDGRAATDAAVVVVGSDGELTVLPRDEQRGTGLPYGLRTTDDGGSEGVGKAASGNGETLVVRAPDPLPPTTAIPGSSVPEGGASHRAAGETSPASSSPSSATSSTAPATSPSVPASPQAPSTAVTDDPTGRAPADPSAVDPTTRRTTSHPANVVRSPAATRHTIRPGDSLWLVAERHVASHGGGAAEEREVAQYWLRLVDENRATLRSGNPGLVYAGEIIVLPPLPA